MAKTAVFYWKNPLFDIDGDLYVVDQNSNTSENRHHNEGDYWQVHSRFSIFTRFAVMMVRFNALFFIEDSCQFRFQFLFA